MKQLAACLLAGAILLVSGSMVSAQDARVWGIDEMNRQIDLTNVIIGTETDGGFCSGTIISIAKRLI
jgi:hypothetical protein